MNVLKPKNGFGKVLAVALLFTLVFVAGLITGRYVVNVPGLAKSETVFEFGGVEGASYVIFKEGSIYYARNGKTGVIDYSGTDASKIIQNAIDATTTGLIYVKAEIYRLSRNITIHDRITFKGDGQDSTVLQRSTDNVAVVLKSNVAWTEGIVLRDLTVHGNSKDGDLVSVESARSVTIINVAIKRSAGIGVRVIDGSWGVNLIGLHVAMNEVGVQIEANAVILSNSILRFNNQTNLKIVSNGVGVKVIDSIIEKVKNVGAWNVYIIGGEDETDAGHVISQCSFEDAPSGGGNIKILNQSSTKIQGVRIIENWFSEDNVNLELTECVGIIISNNYFRGTGLGINITSSADSTLVLGNFFNSTSTISDNGTNSIIDHNLGYP